MKLTPGQILGLTIGWILKRFLFHVLVSQQPGQFLLIVSLFELDLPLHIILWLYKKLPIAETEDIHIADVNSLFACICERSSAGNRIFSAFLLQLHHRSAANNCCLRFQRHYRIKKKYFEIRKS